MLTAIALASLLAQDPAAGRPRDDDPVVTVERLRAAVELLGLEYTDDELRMLQRGVRTNRRRIEQLRELDTPNELPPATSFTPLGVPPAALPDADRTEDDDSTPEIPLPDVERPADLEDLAFASIRELASLVRARRVTCLELTELFLARLQRLDDELHCVVTLTPARARSHARELDAMLEQGRWLGPLHGIPFGAKDLLSARGHPTTWGAKPYEEQVIQNDARVIDNLERNGAVLVAKLSLGALAMGDVWFRAMTRNPWKPEQGSSGSSAGSASATAAGAVPFAIGSETLGSIVSPSHRCGCTGLRPTFGVVSTEGAMALSWTMDKLGPLCRSAEDAALVFAAMLDDDAPHGYRFVPDVEPNVRGMRVGYPAAAFEESENDRGVLDELRALGVELVTVELPDAPVRAMTIVLSAEAAAAFDELTRSNRDDLLVRQGPGAWPNSFRTARLIPAVEYVQAQRQRTRLMRDTLAALDAAGVDVVVHPTYGGNVLALSNLTGHPAICAPRDFRDDGTPRSISFLGRVYGEAKLLALVQAWQDATEHHVWRRPVVR